LFSLQNENQLTIKIRGIKGIQFRKVKLNAQSNSLIQAKQLK